MIIYLGLGSNQGDRKANLTNAINQLAEKKVQLRHASPVIETPALLPDNAPWEWNQPFLNMVIECSTDITPEALLAQIHQIQDSAGRTNKSRWSPRPIDIDILLWGAETISTCLLYTSPSPRDKRQSRMPSSA